MKETFLIVKGLEDFKNSVFAFIVSEYSKFKIEEIEDILSLVNSLKLEDKKLYSLKFKNQTFDFTVLVKKP